MATKVLAIGGGNGKRFLSLIRSFTVSTKRGVHTSAYDKNIDEAIVQPPLVPDQILGPQSDSYWGPNPRTGVFGPIDQSGTEPGLTSGELVSGESVSGESVLDQKVRFRPLEDVEKPVHA